ncbi:MAG: hypothetical protein P8Y61_01745 [Gammaproteobacteria bacterium]|jgi:hypothetical protein
MLSATFLVFSAIHLTLWVWGWRAWSRNGRPRALFLVLFGGTLLFYDNLRIGLGRFIGPGELLQSMTVPAFVWHWTMLPLLVIAAGIIARRAGLGWAQSRFAMGAFCVVATALIALDIPKIFDFDLYPACVADTFRYSVNVGPEFLCSPDDAVITGGPGAALVAILTNVIVLAVGIALWIQRGWPWLALGSGAMFIAAGGFGQSYYGLPIANFGEILITASLIFSSLRFAPGRQPAFGAAA